MAIQLIVGQGVTHNRIFLRKCARWSIIRSLWDGVTSLPSAILPHQRYPPQDLISRCMSRFAPAPSDDTSHHGTSSAAVADRQAPCEPVHARANRLALLARSTPSPAPPSRHTARSLSPFCPPPSARVCRACSPPAAARPPCPYRPCRHALCCDPRTGLPLTRTAGRRIAVHDRAGAVHQGPCLTDQAGCGIRLRRRRSLGHRPSPCAARVGLRAASISCSEWGA